MLIGDYTLIVEEDGAPVASRILTASSGHPRTGDQFRLEGRLYKVDRVEHELDADSLSSRSWSHAKVFIVPG